AGEALGQVLSMERPVEWQQLSRVPYKSFIPGEGVVMSVPASLFPLLEVESVQSLRKYFSLSVLLRSDGIMPQQKAQGIHPAAWKTHVMPTAVRKHHSRRLLLPGLFLHKVAWPGAEFEVRERSGNARSGRFRFIGRRKVRADVVDAIEAFLIHLVES